MALQASPACQKQEQQRARLCGSEAVGGDRAWTVSSPGAFCGEERWEMENGFSLWQCRLSPNQLDLAAWGSLAGV